MIYSYSTQLSLLLLSLVHACHYAHDDIVRDANAKRLVRIFLSLYKQCTCYECTCAELCREKCCVAFECYGMGEALYVFVNEGLG